MLSDNVVKNYAIVPTSAIVKPLYAFDDYERDPRKKFCLLPKRNWARYFGGRIISGEASNLQTTRVETEVVKDEESVVDAGDEESSVDTEDVDSSARYNSSDESILNKCGPVVELYESQSEDSDENNSVDVDDETSPINRALECEEDEYWVNHNSGESYLEDTAAEDSTDDSENLSMS